MEHKILLDAVLHDADALVVDGGKVIRGNVLIGGGDKQIILLRAHGLRGEEHGSPAVRGDGDVAQQVDLPVFQLGKKFRPASLHVFVGPAGIGSDPLLVLIAIAAPAAGRVLPVEVGIVPTHPDYLSVHRGRAEPPGSQERDGKNHTQQQGPEAFEQAPTCQHRTTS